MKLPIMKGSRGLYTQSDSARAPYSLYSGLSDMAACLNVDISDKKRVSRRRGITRQVTAAAHSLFPIGNRYCLFVSGTDLNLLLPDFTTYQTVATVSENFRLSCEVIDEVAYWVNGVERGKIVDGVNEAWSAPADLVSRNQTRIFNSPPTGSLLAYYNGRMYVVVGRTVWYSESYGPDIFSLGDSFLPFETTVQMIRPVETGLFVSDSADTWFLSGSDPASFEWRKADPHPVLPYSDKPVVGSMTLDRDGNYQYNPGGKSASAIWLTQNGVVFGADNGFVHNLTEERIDLPRSSYSGGATLVDGATMIGNFI